MLLSIVNEVHGELMSVSKRIDFLTQGKTKTVNQVDMAIAWAWTQWCSRRPSFAAT